MREAISVKLDDDTTIRGHREVEGTSVLSQKITYGMLFRWDGRAYPPQALHERMLTFAKVILRELHEVSVAGMNGSW